MFSAANSGSRPVMNTAEHMTLANPAAWCSSGSPGGATYGVLSSSDRARASNVLCGASGISERAGAAASAMAAAMGNARLTPRSIRKRVRRESLRMRAGELQLSWALPRQRMQVRTAAGAGHQAPRFGPVAGRVQRHPADRPTNDVAARRQAVLARIVRLVVVELPPGHAGR